MPWARIAVAAASAVASSTAYRRQRLVLEMATPEGRARQEAKRKQAAEFAGLKANAKRKARKAWKNTERHAKEGRDAG